MTLAVPFALYLVADEVGASGVLAVLVAGLYLRATLSREVTSAGWLLGRSVWRYVEFAVSGMLVRLPRRRADQCARRDRVAGRRAHAEAAAAVVAVLVRAAERGDVRARARWPVGGRGARGSAIPYGWRESAVASWAGMRGVVTVATALALPVTVAGGGSFPAREEVVLVALLVVLVTLVVQGLTLAPLIRAARRGQ